MAFNRYSFFLGGGVSQPVQGPAVLCVSLAVGMVLVLLWGLGTDFHLSAAVKDLKVHMGDFNKFIPKPCLFQEMKVMIEFMMTTCIEHWQSLLLCSIFLPVLYFLLQKCGVKGAELLAQAAGGPVDQIFAKAEVAQMVFFWLADMFSDMYVTYKYCRRKFYVFAFLMISIWLCSGAVAFAHRYLSWERCELWLNSDYFHRGLNERGQQKPDFKSFVLYLAPYFLSGQFVLTFWLVFPLKLRKKPNKIKCFCFFFFYQGK